MPRTKKNLLYSEVTDQFFSKMDKEITNIIEITGVFYMFANVFEDLKGDFRRAEVVYREQIKKELIKNHQNIQD